MGFTAIPVSSVHNIIVSPSHRFFSFDSRFPMMHHFNATAGTGRIQRCTTKISAARLIPMYIGNRRHHPQTIGFYDGKTIPTLSSCCSRIVVSSALMSNEESGDIIHTINKNNNITTNNNYSKELDIAVSAVQLACSLCQRLQEDFVLATNTCHNQIESKGDLSPVTVAGIYFLYFTDPINYTIHFILFSFRNSDPQLPHSLLVCLSVCFFNTFFLFLYMYIFCIQMSTAHYFSLFLRFLSKFHLCNLYLYDSEFHTHVIVWYIDSELQ